MNAIIKCLLLITYNEHNLRLVLKPYTLNDAVTAFLAFFVSFELSLQLSRLTVAEAVLQYTSLNNDV